MFCMSDVIILPELRQNCKGKLYIAWNWRRSAVFLRNILSSWFYSLANTCLLKRYLRPRMALSSPYYMTLESLLAIELPIYSTENFQRQYNKFIFHFCWHIQMVTYQQTKSKCAQQLTSKWMYVKDKNNIYEQQSMMVGIKCIKISVLIDHKSLESNCLTWLKLHWCGPNFPISFTHF